MASALTRNLALFGGMIVAGIVCVQAAPSFTSIRGDRGPTILAASHPAVAAMALLVCMVLATGVAVLVGRLVNTAVGLFVLGAGAFTLDGRLHSLRELAFSSPSRATFIGLAVEAVVLGTAALGLVLVVFRFTGGFRDVEPKADGTWPHWVFSKSALRSAAAGVIVPPAVWLIAQSPMKGQAIAGVVLGSIVAGLIGRLAAPHVQPILLFVSPVFFGALGYAVAAMTTSAPLDEAIVAGTVSAFARIMPLDYLAGSLLGVAFGLGWAKSFLHHEDASVPASA